jgi:nicotinate phosphoribosyltransferase
VLNVIYKLSEVTDAGGRFLPAMKLSCSKTTLPGRKQVYRVVQGQKQYARDILALDTERVSGQPLLEKVFSAGKRVVKLDTMAGIRRRIVAQNGLLPERLRRITSVGRYPVAVSRGLSRLAGELSRTLAIRQRDTTDL